MITSKCQTCSKEIKYYPSLKRKYCSHRCYTNRLKGKDIPWLEEHRKKLHSPESRAKISKALKGRKLSEEQKEGIRQRMLGKPAWNKGLYIEKVSGSNNKKWKGGKYTDLRGYVWVWVKEHPYGRKKPSGRAAYVQEHRLVMEDHLGRHLTPEEFVHHRNGVKDDNRIENLQIVTKNLHYGEVSCPSCDNKFLIR